MTRKIKTIGILLVTAIAIVIGLSRINCNCNKKQTRSADTVTQINSLYDPITQILQKQNKQLQDSIAQLQLVIDQLQPQKETARKQAVAAVAKGKQTTNCDSLRHAFNLLSDAHERYVTVTKQEADKKSEIINQQKHIISNQYSEIELHKSKFANLQMNFEGLTAISEKISKDLEKAERKLKRRGNLNKVFIIAAAVAGGVILLK